MATTFPTNKATLPPKSPNPTAYIALGTIDREVCCCRSVTPLSTLSTALSM